MVLKIRSFKCFQPQVYQSTPPARALYKKHPGFLQLFPCSFQEARNHQQRFVVVVQSLCPTLCHPTDCSTPGLPVPHHLPELAQTHVHWIGDAIQPSHPLPSPSPPSCQQRLLSVHGLEQNREFLSLPLSPPISLSFLLPPPEKQHRMWDHKYIDAFQITMGEVEGSGSLLKSISQTSEMTSLLIWGGSPSICCFFC